MCVCEGPRIYAVADGWDGVVEEVKEVREVR